MNDQLVAETATKKGTPLAGFELKIERLQNYPLNCSATGMGITRDAVYEYTSILSSYPVNALWPCYKDRLDSAVKEIQGDTKERELLKCHVQLAALWNRTLSYRKPCHPVIMEQWNGKQRAFAIKMF